MCRKYHRYGNIQILDNNINESKFLPYIINYIYENMSRKKRKGIKLIKVTRPDVIDFYYHINSKIHKADYYSVNIWFKYKKAVRVKSFTVNLSTF